MNIDDEQNLTVLIGNPNVGKSVIFFILTGEYHTVSNYPGTTVDISLGSTQVRKTEGIIIDTPGTDSLIPMSEDEKVTKGILVGAVPNTVVQVADAKNLKRGLMLFLQLSEFEIPMVFNLNMIDEAESRFINIDSEGLSEELGIPVFETVATERRGTRELKRGIKEGERPHIKADYPQEIDEAMDRLGNILGNRGLALLYLAAPEEMERYIEERYDVRVQEEVERILAGLHSQFSRDLSYVINRALRERAEQLSTKYSEKEEIERSDLRERISNLTLRPLTGIPIFIAVILLLYEFVGYVGAQILVDLLESSLFGGYINPFLTDVIVSSIGNNFISELLVGDFGVITVGLTWAISIILPIIATFFLAFSILEDVGYIPRLGAMADRLFRRIGLNGKAVLPMVLGFGCDTMATMTTRVLSTKKERTISTLMLALGIPCSAQLGVIFAVMALLPIHYFFIWIVVVVSQLLLVAWMASKILPGRRGDFIMELPPLRAPRWDNVFRKTYYKVLWFFKEALPLFILGTFLISVLDIVGALDILINALEPVVGSWMGLPPESSVFFILGFLRRDFGAAGLLDMAQMGSISGVGLLIAIVAVTLFVPCIANLLMIIKERGAKTAAAIVGFIIPFAFLVAGLLRHVLEFLEATI